MKIGIDLGGTKTEAILINDEGKELFRKRIKTENNYQGTLNGIASLIDEIETKFQTINNIGIGMPGAISIDSALIKSTPFFIAILISSSVFPMPEKTIFLALIPAFVAFNNSPIDTISAPEPIFFSSFNKVRFEFDFTEKHIIGLTVLNALLRTL
jgi:hypothetical protein